MADTEERRVVQLEIIAKGLEDAQARLRNLEKSGRDAADALEGLQGRFNTAKQAVEAFAAAVGVFELGRLIQSTADAQTELFHMAEKTGVAVTMLSSLKQSAMETNTPFEGLTKGLGFMATNLVNAAEGGGKATLALANLGLNAKTLLQNQNGMAGALTDIAAALGKEENFALRTAYARAILGRAGQEYLPLLLNLAENGEREAIVTDQQAAAAAQYSRILGQLRIEKERLLNTIVSQAMPAMQAFAKTLLDTAIGADSLNSKATKLAAENKIREWALGAAIAVAMVIDAFRGMVTAISLALDGASLLGTVFVTAGGVMYDSMRAVLESLQSVGLLALGAAEIMQGRLLDGVGHIKQGLSGLKSTWVSTWDDMKARVATAAQDIDDFDTRVGKAKKELADGSFAEGVLRNFDEFRDKLYEVDKGTSDLGDHIGKYIKTPLDQLSQSFAKATVEMKLHIEQLNTMGWTTKQTAVAEAGALVVELERTGALRDLALKTSPAFVAAAITRLLVAAQEKDVTQGLLDDTTEMTKAREEDRKAIWSHFDALVAQEGKLKEEIETFGMSKVQVIDWTIVQIQARIAVMSLSAANADAIVGLNAQIEKLQQLRGMTGTFEDIKNQVSAWGELANRGADFFRKLAEGGKDAFSILREEVKKFAADLLTLFARKYFLQMIAGVVGGSAGDALANQASTLGANTLAGQLLGAGGSFLGGAAGFVDSALGLGGTFGAAAGGGFSAGLSTLGIAATAGADAVGGFAAVVGAAIPVIGWVAAAGAILYSVFAHSGGGPKQQGFFSGMYDSAGNLLNATNSDVTHISGDNQNQAQSQQLGQLFATNFATTLRALGGHAGNFEFGQAFSTDPAGTAPSFAHTVLRDAGGRTIYQNLNDNVGRDQASLQAELAIQSQRALLAALQASDLPDDIAKIINGLNAETASQDDITKILAYADAIGKVNTILTSDATVLTDVQEALANTSADNAFHKLGASLHDLVTTYDGSTKGTQNLVTATVQYQAALINLVAEYAKAGKAIDTMFSDTIRNIQFSVLNKPGQYAFLQSESANLLDQALSSSDVTSIQDYARRINQDITQAFNLLTPEEQAARAPEFVARANAANAAIQTHLHELQQQFIEEGKNQVAEIRKAILDAAAKFNEGATTNNTAANTNLTASNNNLTASRGTLHIVVDVRNGTASVVTDGG